MEQLLVGICDAIAQEAAEQGLGAQEIAKRAGLSRGTVHRVLSTPRHGRPFDIRISTYLRLATALDVATTAWLPGLLTVRRLLDAPSR
jgi:transcriptional regulator with XRE-family HTH domain